MWTPPSVPAGACPSGYTYNFNRCYRASTTEANFADARKACQAEGGDLAHPTNTLENKFVSDLAMAQQPAGLDPTKHRPWVWIAAQQSAAQCVATPPRSDLQWVDDGVQFSDNQYQHWREATSWNTRCECHGIAGCKQCVTIGMLAVEHTQGKTDTYWYDHICVDPKVRYVCQRPTAPGTPTVDISAFEPKLPITWCELQRALDTCEPDRDVQLSDKLAVTLNALVAWSDYTAQDDSIAYHGPPSLCVCATIMLGCGCCRGGLSLFVHLYCVCDHHVGLWVLQGRVEPFCTPLLCVRPC